jgi:plastocyanin
MDDSQTIVVIEGMEFLPEAINVRVGDTITWYNEDTISHSIESDEGSEPEQEFSSPVILPGESYSHEFTFPGTLYYHCAIHPEMKAQVYVIPRLPG